MINEIIEKVSQVIQVPLSELDERSGPSNHPRWDSLAHVAIISAIEETYGINFSMNEILSVKSIKDLNELVKRYKK